MSWRSYKVWSDIVGLASAAAMVYPAWRDDWIGKLVAHLKGPRPAGADPNAGRVGDRIAASSAAWSPRDRFWLRVGVALLFLSFALKMCHHSGWQLP